MIKNYLTQFWMFPLFFVCCIAYSLCYRYINKYSLTKNTDNSKHFSWIKKKRIKITYHNLFYSGSAFVLSILDFNSTKYSFSILILPIWGIYALVNYIVHKYCESKNSSQKKGE